MPVEASVEFIFAHQFDGGHGVHRQPRLLVEDLDARGLVVKHPRIGGGEPKPAVPGDAG